jgi:ribosomal protein S18 acetylase RimI-like enzyme
MKLSLQQQEIHEVPWAVRNIRDDDMPDLSRLMLDAYRGTIDYEGETLDDAAAEIRGTLGGQYGPFLRDCSFAVEESDELVAACLVTWSDILKAPFLAYSITRPDRQSQGLAAFLIKTSVNALLARGHRELHLVVTEGNAPAQHLYEKLGFRACGHRGPAPLQATDPGRQSGTERETA